MMKQVEISEPGGPEVLVLREAEIPEPKPFEVLIKVVAAGVNRPDIVQRQGNYKPPEGASKIPGLEFYLRPQVAYNFLVSERCLVYLLRQQQP